VPQYHYLQGKNIIFLMDIHHLENRVVVVHLLHLYHKLLVNQLQILSLPIQTMVPCFDNLDVLDTGFLLVCIQNTNETMDSCEKRNLHPLPLHQKNLQ